MENRDLELEQRVWQRISGGNRGDMALESLILEEEEAAAVYRHLAQHENGSRRAKLLELQKQSREDAGILKGILKMSGGQWQDRPVYQPERENRTHLLARICRRCMSLEQRYEAMSSQGEFGCVARQLAERKAGNLGILLGMIGE